MDQPFAETGAAFADPPLTVGSTSDVPGFDPASPQPSPMEEVRATFAALTADARSAWQAETRYWKARADHARGKVVMASMLLAASALIASCSLIALTVGLLFLIAEIVGLAAATALVVIVLLLVAAGLGWLAVRQIGSITRPGDRS